MKKLISILAASMLLTACAATPQEDTNSAENPESLNIVTTIAPLYSLTASIVDGVENVEITNLVPINTSVHSFSLKASDAKAIENASLIVMNGLELELFLESTLEDKADKIVDTSEGVEVMKFEDSHDEHEDEHDDHEHDDHEHDDEHEDEHDDHEHDDEHEDEHEDHEHEDEHEDKHDDDEHEEEHDDHEHEDEHGHVHGEYDPHIWLSPMKAVEQAQNIADAIIAIDPENKALYEENLADLTEKLEQLDADFRNDLASVEATNYIVFHDAYAYLESAYSLSPSTHLVEIPGIEPSSAQMAEIAELIEEENIKVAFSEPQFNPKLLSTLADDYGLTIFTLDPLGQEISKDAYLEMQYANLEELVSAFTIE